MSRKRRNSARVIECALEDDSDESLFDSAGESEYVPDTDSDDDSANSSAEATHSDSSDDSSDGEDDDWKNTENDPIVHNFIGQQTINIQATDPLQIFSCIFDDDLFNKLVVWVNKRAEKVRGQPASEHSSVNMWKATTVDELKVFFGLCIIMGNIQMPSIKHYWSQNGMYYHPIFGKTMSRTRFELILRFLCFYDADTDPTNSKLHKIDQILTHLLANFRSAFSPGCDLALDEAMVLWRGRLSFRQYIKNKRHKYGIKLYELCTHDGFILNILIYTGKNTVLTPGKGHAFAVVTRLMEEFLGQGHTLFLDNYYNSVDLAEHLTKNKTNMCGTLQINRKGNPVDVTGAKLKQNECISRQKGNITVLKWRDRRNVLMISSTHGPKMTDVVTRRGTAVRKPVMVVAYNTHMGGIDRSDQMISYYSTPRKSLRWYIKLFFHLFDAALWNSTYLYSKLNQKTCPYLKFREMIAASFLNIQIGSPSATRHAASSTNHFPARMQKRLRCRQCRITNNKKQLTFYMCNICKDEKGNVVGLCADTCFAKWHTK